jgi:hypothetical protein
MGAEMSNEEIAQSSEHDGGPQKVETLQNAQDRRKGSNSDALQSPHDSKRAGESEYTAPSQNA